MGIQGLLPFIAEASENINIKTLKGATVAIDSYCWLHKGAFGVGDKLVRGEETYAHIMYCMKYVNMLLQNNIKPILVFDGRHLPAKAETEAKRRESRKNAKQRGIELMRSGNHKEAQNHFRRCVDITHEMALLLIQTCRAFNVDCIVAPYEADAQLAYLNKIGLADYVITEDSDLTLFGCRKILFKLDSDGNCVLVDSAKLHLAMNCHVNKFTMEKFRTMCILSGCDYVDSLPGIGLAKACKFVMKTEETDLMRALDKIPAYLNMRHLTVTEDYKISVLKAMATFLHMVVFDPRRRKQVRLNDIEGSETDVEHCCNAGEILDDATALNLAVGNLNPFTMKKLDNWHPDQMERPKPPANIVPLTKGLKVAKHTSIWQRDYRFTVSLTKAAPMQPKTPVKRASLPKRRVVEAIEESDDENLPTESQNDDYVVNQYINTSAPSQKRFKEYIEEDDESIDMEPNAAEASKEPTTPKRNPFKKAVVCKDELLSPTQISKENNSLIKNQSPVKRIDFGKLEKISRFNRTVMPNKNQHVFSRFFNGSEKPKSKHDPPQSTETDISHTENNIMNTSENVAAENKMTSPNLLCVEVILPNPSLYFIKSDSTVSSNTDNATQKTSQDFPQNDRVVNDGESELSQESQRSILNQFKFTLKEGLGECDAKPIEKLESGSSQTMSDKTDSESNQLPIVLCDDDDDDEISSSQKLLTNRTLLNGSQKMKVGAKPVPKTTSRRKKSTVNRKSSNSTNSSDTQKRLSLFGFKKMPVFKH